MNKALIWFLARVEEPSTWGSSGVLAFGLHQLSISTTLADAILAVGMSIGGLLGIVIPEKVPA